jgi:aminotransferase
LSFNAENRISQAVKSVPPSGIRKFFDLIARTDGVISLGIGEPDFVTPRAIIDAAVDSLYKGNTCYTSNSGMPELREEIANYLFQMHGLEYDPESQILITVGGSEAVDLALRAVLNPGDEVLIPEPCYVSYQPCTIFAGGKPVVIPTCSDNAFKLTPEQLRARITPRSRLLLLNYPNNPTGATMTLEELELVARVVLEHDLLVLSDEIYNELIYDGSPVSFASLPGMQERTIMLNGFSKSYAMTGWRIGYAAGHPALIGAMNRIHQYSMLCAPVISQVAAVKALQSGKEEKAHMVAEYNRRRRVMVDGFRRIGLDCFEPLGAFYCFPSIKRFGMTSEVFAEKLLITEKVAVVPGTAFGASGEGYVRCCYACSMENIEEALLRIERFLSRL